MNNFQRAYKDPAFWTCVSRCADYSEILYGSFELSLKKEKHDFEIV